MYIYLIPEIRQNPRPPHWRWHLTASSVPSLCSSYFLAVFYPATSSSLEFNCDWSPAVIEDSKWKPHGTPAKTKRRTVAPLLPESNHSPLLPLLPVAPTNSLSLSSSSPLTRSLLTLRLLPSTRTASGTNNGVKFIRLHIGTIKRQADRQPSERASGQAVRQHKGRINFKYHILVPT